jgi:hypothetical protein
VSVFEPGWMPGTALGRGAPAAFRAISRALGRIPAVSTPQCSGPLLAALAVDDKWAHLRDGAFVVKTKLTEVRPVAHDRDRERRLWEATTELLERAVASRWYAPPGQRRSRSGSRRPVRSDPQVFVHGWPGRAVVGMSVHSDMTDSRHDSASAGCRRPCVVWVPGGRSR